MLVLKQRHGAWTRLEHKGAVMRVMVKREGSENFLVFDMPSKDFQVLREDAVLDTPRSEA